MDISLAIKQFGVERPIASVEEGLDNFVKVPTPRPSPPPFPGARGRSGPFPESSRAPCPPPTL